METAGSHQSFYKTGPYAQYLVQAHSTGSVPIEMFEADQPAGHFPDPAFPNVLLYLAVKGCREARFDWGAGKWRGRWRASDLTLVPPDASSDVEMSDRHRFVAVCLPAQALDLVCGEDKPSFLLRLEPLFSQPFRDELVYQLALELWRVGKGGGASSGWYADHLATTILGRLDSLAAVPQADHAERVRYEQLVDFIDAHPSGKLSLQHISSAWKLSARQLQNLVKAHSGLSLYQLVLERRLLAARAMLQRPESDLAEVALACGFSSQAHLTSLYLKRFGTTPGKARRMARIVPLGKASSRT